MNNLLRDTEYFKQVHDDADRDIGACIDHVRDIALNVVRDVLGLSHKECSVLSLESGERYDEALRALLNGLVWVSVDHQVKLVEELGLGKVPKQGQGSGNRAATKPTSIVSLVNRKRDRLTQAARAIG